MPRKVELTDEELEGLKELGKLIKKGKVKIIVEENEEDDNISEVETKRVEKFEKKRDVVKPEKSVKRVRTVKKVKKIIYNDDLDATVFTPVLIISIISGLLTGIPLLGIFFIILLPVFGVFMMKLFPMFLDIRPGMKKAILSSVLAGVLSSLISVILLMILEIFIAGLVYDNIYSYLSFLDPSVINILLGITGFDKNLSFTGLFARFIISIIVYPVLLAIGAVISVKFIKN